MPGLVALILALVPPTVLFGVPFAAQAMGFRLG